MSRTGFRVQRSKNVFDLDSLNTWFGTSHSFVAQARRNLHECLRMVSQLVRVSQGDTQDMLVFSCKVQLSSHSSISVPQI